jgi:hypothetical protein
MDEIQYTTPEPQQPPRPSLFGLGRRGAAVATAVGLMTGGVLGGYIVSHAATASTTATATPAPSGTTAPSGTAPADGTAPSGTFHPNEDPTHEAGESAAREAQENAGQRPTVP